MVALHSAVSAFREAPPASSIVAPFPQSLPHPPSGYVSISLHLLLLLLISYSTTTSFASTDLNTVATPLSFRPRSCGHVGEIVCRGLNCCCCQYYVRSINLCTYSLDSPSTHHLPRLSGRSLRLPAPSFRPYPLHPPPRLLSGRNGSEGYLRLLFGERRKREWRESSSSDDATSLPHSGGLRSVVSLSLFTLGDPILVSAFATAVCTKRGSTSGTLGGRCESPIYDYFKGRSKVSALNSSTFSSYSVSSSASPLSPSSSISSSSLSPSSSSASLFFPFSSSHSSFSSYVSFFSQSPSPPFSTSSSSSRLFASSQMQRQKLKKVVESVAHEESRDELRDQQRQEERKKDKEKRKKETKAWRVILFNDDLHTFKYVTEAIVQVIPQLSRAKAHTITVEAHRSGQASVLSTWKQKAEQYSEGLQRKGLSVSLAPDTKFEKNKTQE